MSLDWGITKIDGCMELCWLPDPHPDGDGVRLNPVTEALIWKTLSVGIGSITKANAPEFYARVHLLEKLDGPSLNMPNEDGELVPTKISPDDVRRHIGLETNATFKIESRGTWLNRICGVELNDAKRHYETVKRARGERGLCAACKEPIGPDDDVAEMHDANMLADPELFSEAEAGIVHVQCGIERGWVVS